MTEQAGTAGGALGVLLGLVIGAATANPVIAAGGLLLGVTGGAGAGVLAGALDQDEEEKELVAKVAKELKPDGSALAMLAWIDRPTELLETLEGLKGKVIETTLSAKDEEALRETLEGKDI